jgi:hypothetical protein
LIALDCFSFLFFSHTGLQGRAGDRRVFSASKAGLAKSSAATEIIGDARLLQDPERAADGEEAANHKSVQESRAKVAPRQFPRRGGEEARREEVHRHSGREGGPYGRREARQVRPGRGSP